MTADLSGRDFRAGRTAAPQSGGRFLVTLSLLTLMLPITFTLGSLTMTPSRALFMVLMPIQLIGLLSGRFGKVTYVDWLILAYMFWRTVVPFYHNPNVSAQIPGGWCTWGENIAFAPSIEIAFNGLVNSPGHYANMTNPQFNNIGIGVVIKNGSVYVTQVFAAY